ncbi:hypothetical protein P8452_43420 [Trifolium repens]|nr:WPP domain-interacting tail-anchored protein [Trifolium repens]WJX57911.1 hypothetical protein P8452_43420 [Trifolium repens]
MDEALGKLYSLKEFSTKENDMQDLEISLQALTEIDHRLAYSSEKLVNLHILYIYLLARENDLEEIDSKNTCNLENLFENAMMFDLLSGILDSEVRELDSFMETLHEEIVDARRKILSCRHLTEVFFIMDEKLQDSEESAKKFQQQLLELKFHSSKLQISLAALQDKNCETGKISSLSENDQISDVKVKSNDQTVEQRRYILRMLEKSLARELDLEKKLAESRNNEELKLKLRYTEQVAFYMEEAAEVVWGRFLEADNATEVLMGISKGIMGRLQVTEFNLNGSMKRENELNSKVQNLTEQLKAKDVALEKHERCNVNVNNIEENSELLALREKMKFLEQERKDFEVQINSLTEENEACQEHLIEVENFVESLKENIDIAENRAESAEAKVTQLTETNIELTEELNFLKGNASTVEKKVGSLEKQLREFDIQLQNAKASSEASQEQQNMLYSAIWDMEILIEELKSKVSIAESNKDIAEEQCIVLSEKNEELHKELDLLKSRMHILNTKLSTAKEVDTRTKFIMDLVMQVASERERVNKLLDALKQENKRLVGKLKDTKIGACNNGLNNRNEDQDSNNIDSSNDSCTKSLDEEGIEHFDKTFQVGEQSEVPIAETQTTSSVTANRPANWRSVIFLSLTILISVLVFFMLDQNTFSFLRGFES